jgi:hypothetical protein
MGILLQLMILAGPLALPGLAEAPLKRISTADPSAGSLVSQRVSKIDWPARAMCLAEEKSWL